MNRNALQGLIILLTIVIAAVLLWQYYPGTPPGPGPKASKPSKTSPATPTPQASMPGSGPAVTSVTPKAGPGVAPLQEPTTPEPKVTVLPPPAQGKKYGILVGTYPKYPQAARMLAKLKKRHQPAFVQRDPRDTSRFQVWLGPYSSHDEAQAAQKSLHARLKKPLEIQEIENPVPK